MNAAPQASLAPHNLAVRADRSWVAPASSLHGMAGLVRASPLRVLLVDDCPFQQLLACALQSRQEIVPQAACDGLEAVLLVGQQNFDIVLMDVEMPIMDGPVATARIRTNERRDRRAQAVGVVAYTAGELASDERNWQRCDMAAVLHKPAEAAEMRACLERWCGTKFSSSGHQAPAGPFQALQESADAR